MRSCAAQGRKSLGNNPCNLAEANKKAKKQTMTTISDNTQGAAQTFDFGYFEVAVHSLLSPSPGGRSENQDNFLTIDRQGYARFLWDQQQTVEKLEQWPEGHMRFAILDGMGGHSHGRQAAEQTVKGLLAIPAVNNLGSLDQHITDLHRRLRREMHVDGAEPGCTLTLIEVPPIGPALLFHVGDSRLYAVDQFQADYLTIDHVPITRFAIQHLVDKEEWFQQAHVQSGYQISQAFILGNSLGGHVQMGLDAELYELREANLPAFLRNLGDRRALQLSAGVTYVLASDGLWHLKQPLEFIDRWPQLLSGQGKPLQEQGRR